MLKAISLMDRMDKIDIKRWNAMEQEELAKVIHSYIHLLCESYKYGNVEDIRDELWISINNCIPDDY